MTKYRKKNKIKECNYMLIRKEGKDKCEKEKNYKVNKYKTNSNNIINYYYSTYNNGELNL